jgi:hypothetical protein
MSIEFNNYKQEGIISCDECGESEEYLADDFYDFITIAKNEGWRIKKIDDEWQHFCENCVNNS